jgi:hypothetical protein
MRNRWTYVVLGVAVVVVVLVAATLLVRRSPIEAPEQVEVALGGDESPEAEGAESTVPGGVGGEEGAREEPFPHEPTAEESMPEAPAAAPPEERVPPPRALPGAGALEGYGLDDGLPPLRRIAGREEQIAVLSPGSLRLTGDGELRFAVWIVEDGYLTHVAVGLDLARLGGAGEYWMIEEKPEGSYGIEVRGGGPAPSEVVTLLRGRDSVPAWVRGYRVEGEGRILAATADGVVPLERGAGR